MPRLLLLIGFLLAAALAHAQEPLPSALDLRADGVAARGAGLPIVLFFHSRRCHYCREVEENYLRPLLAENARRPRFLFRAVEIDAGRPLTDFIGRATTQQAFSKQQGVRWVPHLRFVGPDGAVLAPDLVGLTLRDFYGAYIDEAITRAGEKLRGKES